MSALSAFGLFAVTAMLVCYALEERSPWFTLAFASPRTPMRTLAELFLFPERRLNVNRLLERLHRGAPDGNRPVS